MVLDERLDNHMCVQALVDNGAALDARDVHGRTPLQIASMQGYHLLIELLAPSPVSFQFKDNDGCTPLYYACENSHVKCIRKFIVQISDVIGDLMKVANNYGTTPPSVRTGSDRTILHVACEKGEIDLVQKLLKAGADPNVTDEFGFTPLSVRTGSGGTILHVACDEGDINLVTTLLDAGADPNVTDEFGFTPLMGAVVSTIKSGITTDVAYSIIAALYNCKCSVNALLVMSDSKVHFNKVSTALHMAIDERTVNQLCVEALVDNGAALDTRDVHGRTPFHLACEKGNINLVKKLLEAGVDPNVTDEFGFTPLMRAVLNTHVSDTDMSSIVTIICNGGCNVNAKFLPCKSSDKYMQWKGTTALHFAVYSNLARSLCVKALIDNGALL